MFTQRPALNVALRVSIWIKRVTFCLEKKRWCRWVMHSFQAEYWALIIIRQELWFIVCFSLFLNWATSSIVFVFYRYYAIVLLWLIGGLDFLFFSFPCGFSRCFGPSPPNDLTLFAYRNIFWLSFVFFYDSRASLPSTHPGSHSKVLTGYKLLERWDLWDMISWGKLEWRVLVLSFFASIHLSRFLSFFCDICLDVLEYFTFIPTQPEDLLD